MEFSWHYNNSSRKPPSREDVLICVINPHLNNAYTISYYIAHWDALDNVWVDAESDFAEYSDMYVVSWSHIPFPVEDVEDYIKGIKA